MILLEAESVHKIYNQGKKELHVLKGIDLRIEKGKIVSIVGPSGAGKSTLLHLLGGLDRPSQGEVLLEGVDVYKLGDAQRAAIRNKRIGFVFQFYHLLPEFSALENVMLPGLIANCPPTLKLRRASKLRDKARDLLGELGLEHRLYHRPSELSGGEQQRVAIARALINKPEIVFCDEPTGNLDSKTGEEICQRLWRLNKEKNQTLVIVTHEERITRDSDAVVHIQDGKLVGPPDQAQG